MQKIKSKGECAISWLIISLGAIDICIFAYILIKSGDLRNSYVIGNIDRNVQLLAKPIKQAEDEKARREDEEKAKRAVEEKAIQEAEEKARREAQEQARREAEERTRREVEARAQRSVEEAASKPVQAPANKEKTLTEGLEYALQFQTDEGLVSYLKKVNDETVQNILKSPCIRSEVRFRTC